MGYRIALTVQGNPDPMLSTAHIGLLSNVELWLGIIVACLPTMAPFLRTYVQPGLSKISQKLYGSFAPSTKEGTPRVQLKTIGGSRNPGSKSFKGFQDYSEPSAALTDGPKDSEELHLVAHNAYQLQTDCEVGNANSAPGHNGIYVQRQFQTLDV